MVGRSPIAYILARLKWAISGDSAWFYKKVILLMVLFIVDFRL